MRWIAALGLAGVLVGCGAEDGAEEAAPDEEPTAEPESEAEDGPPENRYPNEACARVIVVAWDGAQFAADDIERSEEEARDRAESLRRRVLGGEGMASLARSESDASSSGPRGGLLGTYTRAAFPEIHAPIRDRVFALDIDEVGEVIRAPYGFVVVQRCPVQKIHTRHILVRYRGARNAGEEITRERDAALQLAHRLRRQITSGDAEFSDLASRVSEDSSRLQGGDLGMVGRGNLAQAYEATAWQLEVNEISQPIETEFGFHIIQRLEDLPEEPP